MIKKLTFITIIVICLAAFLSGCSAIQDSDEDGYKDNIDEFPSNPKYHATCTECKGSGVISTAVEKNIEFEADGSYTNRGFFNPDYYSTVTVKNLDSVGGIFEVYQYAEDNGVTMWSDSQSSYISPGQTQTFNFHYDADEEMDNFRHRVTPPTKVVTVDKICTLCSGSGKI
jgi:hypothetical protein